MQAGGEVCHFLPQTHSFSGTLLVYDDLKKLHASKADYRITSILPVNLCWCCHPFNSTAELGFMCDDNRC